MKKVDISGRITVYQGRLSHHVASFTAYQELQPNICDLPRKYSTDVSAEAASDETDVRSSFTASSCGRFCSSPLASLKNRTTTTHTQSNAFVFVLSIFRLHYARIIQPYVSAGVSKQYARSVRADIAKFKHLLMFI